MLGNKCLICKKLTKKVDDKNRVRYSCPFAPEIEWLYDVCDEPLNASCMNFEQKVVEENQ